MAKRCTNFLRVHVEGNIGSGKSTLLDFLKKKPNIEVHPEPLEKWQNLNGFNIFEKLYRNPQKYLFPFQSFVLLTLAQRNLFSSKKPIQVFERSFECVRKCFINVYLKDSSIDLPMKAILDSHIDFFNQHTSEEPDLIIYVRTSPGLTIDRIQNRGRSEEREIETEYLNKLHCLHEEWLVCDRKEKVFIIDGDCDFENLDSEYKKCMRAIEQALFEKEMKTMQHGDESVE